MAKLSSLLIISLLLLPAASGFAAPEQEDPVTLGDLVTVARARNPEIIAARERWNAAKARVTSERTWDDPKLIAEYWSIPEGGFDVSAASEKMYGFSQMIPFPGKLSVKAKAAGAEAEGMRWEYRDTELRVLAELKALFAQYVYTSQAIGTYRQTAEIMRSFSKVAEARYVAGKSAQSDVLRAQVEAEKMANMVLTLEQERETLRIQVNQLLGRDADTPLGEPQAAAPAFLNRTWDDVKALAARGNPDAGKAAANLARDTWARRSAKMAYLPDFDISFRRKQMDDVWAGSDAMVGISVPLWFWKQRAGVVAASADLAAAASEKQNAERMAVARAKEAYTRLDTSRRLMDLYTASVLPKSEQALRVAQASFAAGRLGFLELLDSVRSYLDLRLEYFSYVAAYQKDLASLERAVGSEL